MIFFSAAEIISIIGFIMKEYLLICPTRRKRNENEPDLEQNLDMHVLSIFMLGCQERFYFKIYFF
jgi:hypothetical protein